MKRSGSADLPLHRGHVPKWLSERMATLGTAIIEALVYHYGKDEVLTRLSDPFWFQSFGSVMGMDWHSSGITTSVVGALKRGLAPISKELGIYVCGGRGKHSRKTPDELLRISDKIGLDGNELVRSSKLTAKVDNNAVQDGFSLYLHSFIVTDEGKWAVIQQGMNENTRMARRYHWNSLHVKSFITEPHDAIIGENLGEITNLVDKDAKPAQKSMISITHEKPIEIVNEFSKLSMPERHIVTPKDVDLKRLGAVLALAYESELKDFESLLMVKGLGPRTIQSLALLSEVIHGTKTRFSDPARFSFAHGGKDGHPHPVPLKTYDESINVLKNALNHAKLGRTDKIFGLKKLSKLSRNIEKMHDPKANLEELIKKEWREAHKYGGMTIKGPVKKKGPTQLTFFDDDD